MSSEKEEEVVFVKKEGSMAVLYSFVKARYVSFEISSPSTKASGLGRKAVSGESLMEKKLSLLVSRRKVRLEGAIPF